MLEVIVLRGLPASGKSTLARQWCIDRTDLVRANRDDLRAMLHAGRTWSATDEAATARARDVIIAQSLLIGRSVVVDDTNIALHTITQVRAIVEPLGAMVRIYDLDTGVEECIQRDAARINPVGEATIRDLAKQLSTVREDI